MRGDLARERRQDLLTGEGHGFRRGRGAQWGHRPKAKGGDGGAKEETEPGAHGQRFIDASFFSISSEVWIDLELIS